MKRLTKLEVLSNRIIGEYNFRRKEIKLATKPVTTRESVLNAYSAGYRDALVQAANVVAEILHDEDINTDRVSFETATHTALYHTAWFLR